MEKQQQIYEILHGKLVYNPGVRLKWRLDRRLCYRLGIQINSQLYVTLISRLSNEQRRRLYWRLEQLME